MAGVGALLLTADIFLPIPSSLVGTTLGSILGAWPGTVVGAVGLTTGCILGYATGWAIGNPATRRFIGAEKSRRARIWLERSGIAALIVCRAVPVLAEASIITAGVLRLAPLRVFVATTLSNVGISFVYATLGASIADIWSFLLGFALAMAIPGLVLAAAKIVERRFSSLVMRHEGKPTKTDRGSGAD